MMPISRDEALLVVLQRMLQPARGLKFAQHVQPLGKALARDMLKVVGQRESRRHIELAGTDRALSPA